MATTSQLITWIELQCHGWTREGKKGIRPLLNEAHKLLLYDEREQKIYIDPATGNIPYIDTQDGVYNYQLPLSCSILSGLLIDFLTQRDEYPWTYEDFEIKGQRFYKILNVTSKERVGDTPAEFTFVGVNPDDTTEKFRTLYYEYPVEITSESVQHQMPGATDMEYLVPATIKLIEGIDHGNMIEAREYINKVLKPGMKFALDRGMQGRPTFCRKRAF